MYLLPSEQDAERLVKFLGNEKLKVEELKKWTKTISII
jgi:hypothetical protein